MVAVVVAVLDLSLKQMMIRRLNPGEDRSLVDGWLGLELTRNRGLAFGIGGGSRWVALLVAVGAVALLAVAVRTRIADGPIGSLALGLALGGALGNIVDRAGDGSVTDFIAVGPWPRFNLADAALTVGLALLIVSDGVRVRGHT